MKQIDEKLVEKLNAENIEYQQLSTNLDNYNDSLVKRIMLEQLNNEEKEAAALLAVKELAQGNRRLNLESSLMEANREIALSEGTFEEKTKNIVEYLKQQVAEQKKLGQTGKIINATNAQGAVTVVDTRTREQQLLESIINQQYQMNRAENDLIEARNSDDSYTERIDALREILGLNKKIIKVEEDPGGGGNEGLTKAQQKSTDAILELIDKQYRATATENEKENEDIQRKYETIIEQAMEAEISIEEIKKLEAQRDKEVNDKIVEQNKIKEEAKLAAEFEYQERRNQLLQDYQLLTVDELQQMELEKLEEAYAEKLLSEEEYQTAKKAIQDKYDDIAAEDDNKKREQKLNGIREYYATFEALAQTAADFFIRSQDQELAKLRKTYDDKIRAAGDNNTRKEQLEKELAEKEKAIKKKQANTEFIITTAQIIANTALAVAKVWGQTGIAGVVAQVAPIAMGLLELGIANKQRQIAMQAYRGRYPVIGADDGRTYQADIHGPVRQSQIFTRPTLISERGGELVATADHVNNVKKINPALFDDFMSYRFPQRAEGNYPEPIGMTTTAIGNQQDISEMILLLRRVNIILLKLEEKPIKGYIVHKEVRDYEDLQNQIEAYASGIK
jgi:ribosomal protein S28E/S33